MGAADPASEAAEIAVDHQLPLAVVCRVLGASRSTIYARRVGLTGPRARPGPLTPISDDELLELIRRALADSPFAGEGYRKVRARLRRQHAVRVSGKRVLRLLRAHGLLAPQRARGRRKPRPHDGTIIPAAPNMRWGTDATMAWTRIDGWVWVFACIDHYTAEAWTHVAKVGDRFAALQPVYDAVIDRWGRLDADVARGLSLRHDWGALYRSGHFLGSIGWLGITDDAAFLGEPETNGCAERWDPHPQRAVPVGGVARHRGRAPPGRHQVRPDLQHPVADRSARPSHPKGGLPGRPHDRGGMIR
jgi:putative transposase